VEVREAFFRCQVLSRYIRQLSSRNIDNVSKDLNLYKVGSMLKVGLFEQELFDGSNFFINGCELIKGQVFQ
jgi:hypothetical protein